MNKKPSSNGTARRPRTAKQKTAYVTGPPLVDMGIVRRVLEAKGVKTFSPDELEVPSPTLTDAMREALERADLVVAVVDATKESNLVFYEIGLAQASGKPAVVLLTQDAPLDTWIACGVPTLRFDPMNPSSLEYGLDLALTSMPRDLKSRRIAEKQTHPISEDAPRLLSQLRERDGQLTETEFENVIVEAIRASGVQIISSGVPTHHGIDFAVWSNDLSPWMINPLLIQLKLRPSTPFDLSASSMHLRYAIHSGGMLWGLLIYHG